MCPLFRRPAQYIIFVIFSYKKYDEKKIKLFLSFYMCIYNNKIAMILLCNKLISRKKYTIKNEIRIFYINLYFDSFYLHKKYQWMKYCDRE